VFLANKFFDLIFVLDFETQEEHYKNLIQNIKNDMENSNLELIKQKEDLQNQINNFQNFNFQLVKEKKRVKK
jgi:pullulanase/glycogen debranching enzyme